MCENDEHITVSLNNGIISYESKQHNSIDVLVKIPKIVKLKNWNQLKIELADQEILFVLNDQNFKIFSDYNVKNIPRILHLRSGNFQQSNFNGIFSRLEVNQFKIEI